MSPIGVDEWVAQSATRREEASGLRGAIYRGYARVGWWQRLAIVAALGVVYGQLGLNGYQQIVGFNSIIYAILALGLNVVVGWTGLLDLGYVAFYGIGAYGYALFSSHAFGNLVTFSGGVILPTIATVPIVLVAAGVAGVVIGLVALRLHGDYLAIVTLFFGLAFAEFVNNVQQSTLGGNNGLVGLTPFHGFGGQITTTLDYYYVALGVLIVLMATLHLLNSSRTGRAWRAVRDDELAAQAMTIPVSAVKVMAFTFGAMIAALAGTMFAAQEGSTFPSNFGTPVLILMYACLVLGGVGNLAGAVLGGILVTVLQELVASPTDAGYLFYGLLLVVMLVRLRPLRFAVMIAAIAGFGFAVRGIAGAISHSAVDGATGGAGWLGSAMRHFVTVPSHSITYGNILFALLVVAAFAVVRLDGIRRLAVAVPTVYFAACCWEARLTVDPAITAQIMIGAILIVTMAARPQGLLGTRQVEIV